MAGVWDGSSRNHGQFGLAELWLTSLSPFMFVHYLYYFKWCQLSSFIETSRAFVFLVLFDMFFRDPSCRLFSLFLVSLKESSLLLVPHLYSS